VSFDERWSSCWREGKKKEKGQGAIALHGRHARRGTGRTCRRAALLVLLSLRSLSPVIGKEAGEEKKKKKRERVCDSAGSVSVHGEGRLRLLLCYSVATTLRSDGKEGERGKKKKEEIFFSALAQKAAHLPPNVPFVRRREGKEEGKGKSASDNLGRGQGKEEESRSPIARLPIYSHEPETYTRHGVLEE